MRDTDEKEISKFNILTNPGLFLGKYKTFGNKISQGIIYKLGG